MAWFAKVVQDQGPCLTRSAERNSKNHTTHPYFIRGCFSSSQKVQEKIEPGTIVSKLADSVTFMCHASYKTSMTTRETLKDAINSNYRSVCGHNTPLEKCLFGDELPKHIKDIAEVNKMSRKISTSQQSSSSSGKRDKDIYNIDSSQGRARKPYFLNYGGRNRSR